MAQLGNTTIYGNLSVTSNISAGNISSDAKVGRNITASATLNLDDRSTYITATHATTKIVITVPANVFSSGANIVIEKTGAANVEIVGAAGVTINGGKEIFEQYYIIVLQNKGGNIWTAIGGN